MKNKILKKDNILYMIMFLCLLFTHLPLLTKHILTADVLLNNSYYNGYAWEISLGRFGLYFMGLLKGFVSVPSIELTISFILIIIITYFLLKIFKIDEKISKIFVMLLMVLSPIVSATLLFHYCSVPYFLAFLCGVLSVYFYYFGKKKWMKYIIPIICIVISLSMYQAYLSLIVTTFMLYQIKCLFDQSFSFKKSCFYLILLLIGMVVYFILMKLSLLVFHIDMASYSNANQIGLSTLLQIPHKFIESYQLFYQMYFTNTIMKNTFMGNHILSIIFFILFIITMGIELIQSKISNLHKGLIVVLTLLIPVFLNSVIFVIMDAKLQLLMSASYLVFFLFIMSFSFKKPIKVLFFLVFLILMRNYFIQDQATYMTLEETYSTYYTVLDQAIKSHPDQPILVLGNLKNTNPNLIRKNYGYVSDEGIFWDEYHLRKLGVERFCKQAYGLSITFGEESLYQELQNDTTKELIYEYEGIIVVNFNNYV